MKFSRRKLVSAAVSIAFVAGTMASGAAQAVDKIRWAVPMAFGSNLTALGDTMPWVAQLLDKMSGGAIKLSVQEPGKLIPALAVFGWAAGFSVTYFLGVAAAAVILAWEHHLVRPGDLSRLDAAFFTMNGVMSVTVFAFALVDRMVG